MGIEYIPDHAEWSTDTEEDNVPLFAPFEYGDYHDPDQGDMYVPLDSVEQ